jgi:hypothetical protein
MTTPNQMPQKSNKVRQQVLSNLIETKASTHTETKWRTNPDTDELEEVKVKRTRQVLRFPLAQNMSEESVEALAKRWI